MRRCTHGYSEKSGKGSESNLLEHTELVKVMELVVDVNLGVGATLQTIEDHGLSIDSIGDELVVQSCSRGGVMVVLIVAVWVLDDVC